MTTITLTHPDDADPDRPTTAGNSSSFVTSIAELRAGARDGAEIYERYRRLSSMSNAELAELGLTRAEIYRAALLGHSGKAPKPPG
jgi:uncharacterized protein YjiS (DUF1127 family)